MEIPVLYSDSSLLVCEKPVGVPSESPGLPELVKAQYGWTVLPVHRLDQGTGGVIVMARSPASCAAMQRLFRENKIRKEYLAVISGCPEEGEGVLTDLLWHDRQKNKSYIVSRRRVGVKEASCAWKLLNSTMYDDQRISLIRVVLHTGRTHQIRVQFGSRGFPLVGDRKYGSRMAAKTVSLWASAISFHHPEQKNGGITVTSKPPDTFPWNLFDLSAV